MTVFISDTDILKMFLLKPICLKIANTDYFNTNDLKKNAFIL